MSDLYKASKEGNVDIIKLLDWSDINSRDSSGKTALFYASAYNHLEVVKYLLKNKADANVLNYGFKSGPLLSASSNGYTDIVACLLDNGAEVNLADDENYSPLRRSAGNGHFNTVVYLVKHGADVNQLDNTNTSPLWIAAASGYLNIVIYLEKSGADVNIADKDQRTAVSVASHVGHIDTVSYLCKNGANLEIPLDDGRTPLFLACQQNLFIVASCLLEHGANVDACDSEGDSALHMVAMQGYKDIVELLMRYDAKVTCNEADRTPLSLAKVVIAKHQGMENEKVKDFQEIVSMLETYKPKSHTANSEHKDAKNQSEKDKSDSCIIPKDILDSPILKNLAEHMAKEAKEGEDSAAAIIREKMKDENEYLKGLWEEISNVDKQITTPKKNPGHKDLSDKHLLQLAEEMEKDWKRIGGFLGVKHSQIRDLAAEHKDEPTYAAWTMLVSWRDSQEGGVEGKRQELQTVLQDLGRHDIVHML